MNRWHRSRPAEATSAGNPALGARWRPVTAVALGMILISWGLLPPPARAGSDARVTGLAAVSAASDLCAQVSYTAGFRDERLVTAVAVALAESSCNPAATNPNPPPPQCAASIDRGLFQINSCYHPEVTLTCALDAQCNANAAYRISSGGTSWTPWSVYTSGRYRSFLAEATAAVSRLAPALPWRPLCYPVTGDWDGNGTDTLGVACKDGVEYEWGLMNFNGGGSAQIVGRFGNAVDCLPVTGDWDGNGTDTIGVACRSGAGVTWALVNGFQGSPSYPVFGFGNADNCWPVTGDWDGNGTDTIGVACKDGIGLAWAGMNFHGGGSAQMTGGYGNSDLCHPVVGNWDGTGGDTVGAACRSGGGMTWSLVNGFQGSPSYPVFGFGNSDNCRPVTGNWDGSGGDTIGVACKAGHGMSWAMMNFHGGGTPQITAGFGNGDSYQYTTGWPGPRWPNWPAP
jgi:hypothetical protein